MDKMKKVDNVMCNERILPFPEAHLCNDVDHELSYEDLWVDWCVSLFLQGLLYLRVRARD